MLHRLLYGRSCRPMDLRVATRRGPRRHDRRRPRSVLPGRLTLTNRPAGSYASSHA